MIELRVPPEMEPACQLPLTPIDLVQLTIAAGVSGAAAQKLYRLPDLGSRRLPSRRDNRKNEDCGFGARKHSGCPP